MRIKFIGPLDRVTGSCYLLHEEIERTTILVDCGIRQGGEAESEWNAEPFPFDPATLDYVILTHAHLDHSGRIPKLYREGFRGRVVCTRETARLAELILLDSAQHDFLHTEADVGRIDWWEPPNALFGKAFQLTPSIEVSFERTGHLLGAISARVEWGLSQRRRSIVFSGDLGPTGEGKAHPGLIAHRVHPKPSDYAVIESTYGGRIHRGRHGDPYTRMHCLREVLDAAVLERPGPLVIPVFSLGRLQDVLFDLAMLKASSKGRYDAVRLLVDAPLGRRASEDHLDGLVRHVDANEFAWTNEHLLRWLGLSVSTPGHLSAFRDVLRLAFGEYVPKRIEYGNELVRRMEPWATIVHDRDPLASSLGDTPTILVASSGTCTGGPIGTYLPSVLTNPRATMLFTGYCASGTIGAQILSFRQLRRGRVDLGGGNVLGAREIRATIERTSLYSGHADQAGLLDWLFFERDGGAQCAGQTVFVTHGDRVARIALQTAIREHDNQLGVAVEVELPHEDHEWYDLDDGGWGRVNSAAPKRAGESRPLVIGHHDGRLHAVAR